MSDRRLVAESFGTKKVYVNILVVSDPDTDDGDVRDAIRAAAAKALRRFFPKHHEHVHFAVGEQMTLPYPE